MSSSGRYTFTLEWHGKMKYLLPAVLALAACTQAPPPPAPTAAGAPIAFPSIFALLGDRQRLELTSEQVTALDSINSWLTAANREFLETATPEMRGEPERDARGRELPPSRISPQDSEALGGMADNIIRAAEGVERLLTPDQRSRICGESAIPRQRPEAPPQPRRLGAGGFSGAQPAQWPWCVRGAEAPEDTLNSRP